ncbi:MAG: phosphatidylserine decarboxylase family protein [Syntrophomonadaceae bacterium]|jgi:phosphatidylserine decarboxylase|nr:phosphatidylserine decarboxylase family protein [Bacillota bacterium]HQA50108.1 phosphatidylserine decarboxylase family protein [Syntrophomonadaceae bacterium]HQD90894.1 phosphatidylserine decarboxylase family protein [Syntrophomonadaceae bacterium]
MKHEEIIVREGWMFIAIPALLSVVCFLLHWIIPGLVFAVLALFCLFFFRNPTRTIPQEAGVVVAPADGRVMDITRMEEPLFMNGEAVRISIFLSLFNVHINRMPVDGMIEIIQPVSGLYLPAYNVEAGSKNQRNYIGISSDVGRLIVVQITGAIARRLVCWAKVGQYMPRGERFGLIRFGSCTEVYLPSHADIQVAVGDKIRGGNSVIAKFQSC